MNIIQTASEFAKGASLRALLFAGAAALLPPTAAAGTIAGRVLNETSGEYLHGAVVRVLDADLKTSTDIQGNFLLRNVPSGDQQVQVSYIGLGDRVVSVTVPESGVASIDFSLSEELVELEGIQVEETLTGRSAAINQQRVAIGIKNIVNQRDFGQMNDGNLGMALRRMPGVSVDTDGGTEVPRYVNIRGFDASLNSVTLDGNRLASSETGSPRQRGRGTAYGGAARAFALDDMPADAVTNVEIVKAPTPDMDGAALGGTVNLVTKSAFERTGRTVEYRLAGSYSELREEFGYNGAITYSDILSVFGGDRNFGVSFTVSRFDQTEGFDNRDIDWVFISPSDDDLDLSNIRPFEGAVHDYLAPQLAEDRERTGQLAIAFAEDTEFNHWIQDRQRTGFSASFDLKLNDSTELFFKPTYSKESRDEQDFRHHLIMDSSDVSGFHHGDRADPLDQYVSLYGDFQDEFDPGNWAEFRSAAAATGRLGEEFSPGDSIVVDGQEIVFDPGGLVRLGGDPERISTFRPGSGDNGVRTTYNPDGSARGKVRYEGDWHDIDIELLNLNFGGETKTAWGKLEYGAFFSETTKEEEDFEQELERRGFQFGYTRDGSDIDDIFEFEFDQENPVDRFSPPEPGSVDRFRDRDLEQRRSKNEERFYGADIDVTYDIAFGDRVRGSIKSGLKYTKLDRDFDFDEREWDVDEDFAFADFLFEVPYEPVLGVESFRMPFVPDARRIFTEGRAQSPELFDEQFSGNLEDSIEQDYTAQEDTIAVYAMADLSFGKLEVVLGGRYEHTDFETESFVIDGDFLVDPEEVNPMEVDEAAAVSDTLLKKRSYDEFLPSLHLKYNFTDALIGRASLGRTYAKPAIKDMVGPTIIDTEDDGAGNITEVSVNEANFELPTQTSENVDVSIEYYTKGGSRYGLGYFRKDVTNFAWRESFETTSFPGFEGIETIVSRPIANTDAINQGFELFIDQNLYFLPEMFHPFSISANYTYTDSEARFFNGRIAPTVGHSREMYNLSLLFEKGPITIRGRYFWRSAFFENVSISDFADSSDIPPDSQFLFDDVFRNPHQIDLEFAYRFSERVEFFANGTNITEEINRSTQGFFVYPEDIYPHQRRWTFGVKGKF